MTRALENLDTLKERKLTFNEKNNKFNINEKLKDSDKSL